MVQCGKGEETDDRSGTFTVTSASQCAVASYWLASSPTFTISLTKTGS